MAGPEPRFADEEWLQPDHSGRSLRETFRERRQFFIRTSAFALLIGIVILAALAPPAMLNSQLIVGPPPTDRQLLWFPVDRPMNALAVRLQAVDWAGHQVGRVSLPCRGPCSFAASPDGQRLLVFEVPARGEPPIAGMLYEARGTWIRTVAEPSARWADDGRHLCWLRERTVTTWTPFSSYADLVVADDKGEIRTVATVAGTSAPADPGFWDLAVCGVIADRAMLVFVGQNAVHDVIVLELSTGRTIYARHDLASGGVCGCPVASTVAAPSADVAVENMAAGSIQLLDLATGTTVPSIGTSVSGPLHRLSWRGNLALIPAGIIDVRTGRMEWVPPPPLIPSLAAARPQSDDVLIDLFGPNGVGDSVVIVRGDGKEIRLPVNP